MDNQTTPYDMGMDAYWQGSCTNPFSDPKQHADWQAGWDYAYELDHNSDGDSE